MDELTWVLYLVIMEYDDHVYVEDVNHEVVGIPLCNDSVAHLSQVVNHEATLTLMMVIPLDN